MNEIPAPQKFFIYLTWLFAGLMGLAGVVDTLRGAWDFLTVPVALGGSGLIVLFWFAARAYLQRFPWRTNEGHITRLNIGAAVYLFGMIILLWLPQFVELPQADPDSVVVLTPTPDPRSTATPSASSTPLPFPPEREGETLIVIATFHRTEGVADVNIHGEIQHAIQDKLAELSVDNVRVEIEPAAVDARDRDGAENLGSQYDASMIIWGADTGVRLVVSFLNLKEPNFDAAQATVSETERTQLARPDAYAQFVVQDLPNQVSFLALFAVGQSFYIHREYERSITFIQEAIDLLPNEGEIPDDFELDGAYFRLGWLYQITARAAEAIDAYDQALLLNPSYATAFNNRGAAYSEQHEHEKAIVDFNQVITLKPDDAGAYNNRGSAYAWLGNYRKAIANFDQAINLDPDHPLAFYNRATTYNVLGEYEKALADFDQAIALYPQYVSAYCSRGITYTYLGDYERALSDYNKATELDPQFPLAYYNRGVLYENLAQYEKAIAEHDQVIVLNPGFAPAYFSRGVSYATLGQNEKAIADYGQAIEIDPQYADAYNNRGVAYMDQGNYGRALPDFDKAIALDPELANAYVNRGFSYSKLGQYESAIADYDQAILIYPQYVQAYLHRGLVFEILERYPEAIRDLRRCLELSPRSPQRNEIEERISQLEAALENQ